MLLQLYWFTCFPSDILLLCDQRHFSEWTEPDDTGGSLVPPCLWDHLTDSADSTRDPPSYLGSGPISNSLLHSDHPVLTSFSSGGCPLSFASSILKNERTVFQGIELEFVRRWKLTLYHIFPLMFLHTFSYFHLICVYCFHTNECNLTKEIYQNVGKSL